MNLFVVRHCAASGQEPGALLTEEGHRQAQRLADALDGKGIEAVVSSSYVRARHSAEPLARRLGIPVQVDPRLAERVLSSGRLPNWRDALRRSFLDADLAFPGGESSLAATERAVAAVRDIEATGCRTAAVVTHGNLMTLLLRTFDGRFGFAEWAALQCPDCYLVRTDGAGPHVARIG